MSKHRGGVKDMRGLVDREPNGRPTRSKGRDPDDFAPTQVKRLRDAAMAKMESPLWGTEIGRLFLERKITGPQLAAGRKWAKTAARFQVAIDAKPPMRSAALERGALGEPPDPLSDEGLKITRHDRAAKEAMIGPDGKGGALGVLRRLGGRAESVVRAVVEDDEAIGHYELDALKAGLDALAKHWEYDKPQRGSTR